jgi:hypothetical protein
MKVVAFHGESIDIEDSYRERLFSLIVSMGIINAFHPSRMSECRCNCAGTLRL